MRNLTNLTTTEVLVRDRQHRFEDAASLYRQAHELPVSRRAPLRAGAGWLLVRAGLRLGRIDQPTAVPARLAGN